MPILTVEMSKPLSHKDYGWTIFIDEIIKKLNEREQPIILFYGEVLLVAKKNLLLIRSIIL